MWEIKFNKDTAECWSKYDDFNQAYIEGQIKYLDEICRHYGYLYLNRIYETFGVIWDHERYNHCLSHEHGFKIEYETVGYREYLIRITV